jgi:hypothetical protein
MVDKDQPESEAAKQIESQVASGGGDWGHEVLLLRRSIDHNAMAAN